MIDFMSWIRINNRLDTALFGFNSQNELVKPKSTYIVSAKFGQMFRFEINSSNIFLKYQSIVSAPISNNKQLDNSYTCCYQLIDPVMISFELIYTPVLI
jgi:hypothetical protein